MLSSGTLSGGSGTFTGSEPSDELSDEDTRGKSCPDEACEAGKADEVDEADELVIEELSPAELGAPEASEELPAEKIFTGLFSFCAQPESKAADRHIAIMSFLLILNISPKQLILIPQKKKDKLQKHGDVDISNLMYLFNGRSV